MAEVFQIVRRDLVRILKNPLALVVTLGVAVVPCLYAWFNILANWDPYSNTSSIKVAVVNEDEGATIADLGKVNAGDLIVENMQQNTQLTWTFVTEDEAKDGVSAGTYYAAYIIPKDFSQSLADVLEGNADPAQISYLSNEKLNPIAPKVTDTAATTLENEIAANFSEVVTETISDKIIAASTKFKTTLDNGITNISLGINDLVGSLDDTKLNLKDTQNTLDSTKEVLGQSADDLRSLKTVSDNFGESLQSALNELPDARGKAQSMSTILTSKLTDGISAIAGATGKANTQVAKLSGTATAASAKLDSMISILSGARDESQSIRDRLASIQGALENSGLTDSVKSDLVRRLGSQISALDSFIADQTSKIDELKGVSQHVKDGAASVTELADAINTSAESASQNTQNIISNFNSKVSPAISSALDGISQSGAALMGTNSGLGAILDESAASLDQLQSVIDSAKSSIAKSSDLLDSVQTSLSHAKTDLALITSSQSYKDLNDLISINAKDTASFMSDPINLVEEAIFPVSNYGSGIAPFFTNVALWVGGIALIVIYKMEVDSAGLSNTLRPWQGYLARLILLVLIGQLQAIIVCAGNLLIGIQCAHPVAYIVATMVASFCFINIIYSLTVAFKHVGRALAFLILILQVPGSSGMYPIEMMPGFFQAINPWLPFTYANNAMREAIAGFYGNYYVANLAVLCAFVIPALLVGAALRRHLININALFDANLRESDLFVSEPAVAPRAHFKLTTLIKATMSANEYQEIFLARAAHFELIYPRLIRLGYLLIAVVPILLLMLLMVLPWKLFMLTIWAISLVAVVVYLIVVEYLHARIVQKSGLKDLSADELYTLLQESLTGELFAFAPYRKLVEKNGGRDRLQEAISRMKEQK